MEPATLDSSAANEAIIALGRRQHGVVASGQLADLGISRGRVRSRIEVGWLEAMLRGVYALAGARVGAKGYWMAAVLGCGNAVLSHSSAAALHGLTAGGAIEVTRVSSTGRGSRRRFLGRHGHMRFRVHRAELPPDDRGICEEIAVTTPARTILDLAPRTDVPKLEAMLSRAEELRLVDFDELRDRVEDASGRHGTGRLASALDRFVPESLEARSVLEREALALCRDHGLPLPSLNVPIGRFVVDMHWPEHGLVVELDGFAFHRDRRSFQSDRSRDVELQLMGLRVARFTYDDVVNHADRTAASIRRLLDQERSRPSQR